MEKYDRHFRLTETRDPEIVIFEEQYRSLRKEILDRQSRRFWIVAGGALGLPGISSLNFTGALTSQFIYIVPFIVVAISFLFIIEVNGIARAGKFIELRIENKYKSISGWEHYLKDSKNAGFSNQPVVSSANSSFIILMVIFYLFSAAISTEKIFQTTKVGAILYGSAMFCVFLFWIIEILPFLRYSAETHKDK